MSEFAKELKTLRAVSLDTVIISLLETARNKREPTNLRIGAIKGVYYMLERVPSKHNFYYIKRQLERYEKSVYENSKR